MDTFLCLMCLKDIHIQYNHQQDPHHLFRPWTTKCGHLFHRKCLLDWVVTEQSILGNTRQTADPELEVECPTCRGKFTISTSLPLFPALRISSSTGHDASALIQPPSLMSSLLQVDSTVDTIVDEGDMSRINDLTSRAQNIQGQGYEQPRSQRATQFLFSTSEFETSNNTSLMSRLEKENKQLRDENGTLGILLIHNSAELEKYTRKLEEFRADLLEILSKVDQTLAGVGNIQDSPPSQQMGTDSTGTGQDQPASTSTAFSPLTSDPFMECPRLGFGDINTSARSSMTSISMTTYYSVGSSQSDPSTYPPSSSAETTTDIQHEVFPTNGGGEESSEGELIWRERNISTSTSRKPRSGSWIFHKMATFVGVIFPGSRRQEKWN